MSSRIFAVDFLCAIDVSCINHFQVKAKIPVLNRKLVGKAIEYQLKYKGRVTSLFLSPTTQDSSRSCNLTGLKIGLVSPQCLLQILFMADAPKRRKFKCPNCAHIVRFQVDPERTLIACDHCGQLTRVTMKTSQSEDTSETNKPATDLVSQAFEDLDLEGLEHRDAVISSTLGSVDIRGKSSPPNPPEQGRQKVRANAPNRKSKHKDSAVNKPTTEAKPKNSESSTQPTTQDVGLGAPLPPPYTPSVPTTYQNVPTPPSIAVPKQPPADPQQPGGQESLPPITFNLNNSPNQTWAANPKPAIDEKAPLVLPENDRQLLNMNQSATPSDGYSSSNDGGWQGELTETANDDADLDMEFLDPIGQAEVHSHADPVSDQPLVIPEGLEFVEPTNTTDSSKDVRIICRVCDTLSYFPPSEEYVCQDCFSRIDENGSPILEKKQRVAPVETNRPKDEIDDLISTAIDEDEPAQDTLWQAKENHKVDDLIEDTTGLLEEENDESEDDGGELRLAPLEDPTDDYKSSVLPHGFTPEDPPQKSAATDEVATNRSTSDEPDELTENSSASDPQSEEAGFQAAKFHWKNEAELNQQLSVPNAFPEANQGSTSDHLPDLEPSEADEQVVDPKHRLQPLDESGSVFNGGSLHRDLSGEESIDGVRQSNEAPDSQAPDSQAPETENSHAGSNQSLFLDGGTYQPQPSSTGGSPTPAAPYPTSDSNQIPPQPNLQGPQSTPPVPPPFVPDTPEAHDHSAEPNQQVPHPYSAPTTKVAAPTPEGFHAYRDSKPRATPQPTDQPVDASQDQAASPLEFGWAGNWLPLLSSVWVIGGMAIVSFGLAISLWLLSAMGAPDSSVVSRALTVFGLAIAGIPTGILWVWLFSVIVDQKQHAVGSDVFNFNRFVVHAMRLALCFAMCLPGLLLGWIAGFPVLGSMIALFYTSPFAIFLNAISQYSGRPVSFYDKVFVQRMFQHQDVWLSGIGVVGMAFVVSCPFVGLGAYIPMPGVFLAAPALVLFSVVLGLQVVRLTETMKVLVQMDGKS